MKVSIGCDHGGFDLKCAVVAHLEKQGIEVQDFGCYDKSSIDYPDFARPAAQAVADGKADKGIVICTTGIGVSIVANKVPGIRCALCSDTMTARLTREHNDSNVLALGGGVVGPNLALEIVDIWLGTPFSGEARHQRRIDKIEKGE